MAARTARLYDAVHDQLFERADAGHRAAEEGQRGPQVTGDDAEDGGGQHADSGWIAVDVDAGASGTCEWTDTADDWIPAVLVGKRFRKWRGDFLDHVITIIFYFVYFIKLPLPLPLCMYTPLVNQHQDLPCLCTLSVPYPIE